MTIDIGVPNEKQAQFFEATERFTAYGGARGGGKSWAVRKKSQLLALNYPGIKILVLRRTYPELQENHILPLRAELNGIASWKEQDKAFAFPNGSRLKFGYCASESDVLQYQGQEYDIIFMDEATQFTEFQFQTLYATNRGANDFPKRMYLTCNPGGVGHAWVKRLFIDREYRGNENPEEYRFIAATVYDNHELMEKDPAYVHMLETLSPGLREAWLLGSWDVFAGQYFPEWDPSVHIVADFIPPEHWRRYFTMDYGLDMLAGYCVAVDPRDRAYVYREVYEPGLIISDAARAVRELCAGERIFQYFAPPDLWNRRQDTGKSVAEIFGEHKIYLAKAQNQRIDGWLDMKERLKICQGDDGERYAHLRVMRSCRNLIRSIPLLQFDEKRPSDAATEPHEVTHAPDAIRYFCAGRPMAEPAVITKPNVLPPALREDEGYSRGLINW